MIRPAVLARVLARLAAEGAREAEIFAKSSRSRHFERSAAGSWVAFSEEAGWAVRAGGREGSFFFAASGEPAAEAPWPKPEGAAFELPGPEPIPPWTEPVEVAGPLLSERDGLDLLREIEAELAREIPGSRLLSATLDEGIQESALRSSRGIEAAWRQRAAVVRVTAAGRRGTTAEVVAAGLEARKLAAAPVARRLADSLSVAAEGGPPPWSQGEMLLAPPVAARLLAGLSPLFFGPGARGHLRGVLDEAGTLGGPALTLSDHGRLPGGLLAAPVDGEGRPTREVLLVDAGRAAHTFEEAARASGGSAGGLRRPGWRDLPRPGPSHFFLAPKGRVAVASLLARVGEGYYWIDAPGPGSFDLEGDSFRLPVRGFALERGAVKVAVAPAFLTGTISGFLHGMTATARDLAFFPHTGMIGAPTVLVLGGEVVGPTLAGGGAPVSK